MDIKKRLIPCVIIVAVTLVCVLLSRFTRVAFFLVLALVSVVELSAVMGQAGMPMPKVLLGVYITVQAVLCWFRVSAGWMVALFALAAFAVLFWSVVRPGTHGLPFASSSLFALVWPFGFYAVILHAAASEVWLMVLTLGVLCSWACDSMALVGGKYLGVHKLAPAVSPHKTWEGAIVGGASALLAGMLIAWIFGWRFGMCVLVALVSSTCGQVGDLVASLVKRAAGVKDYGHVLPEHGGIMDKMDGMLFTIPAAYFLLALFIPGVF